MTTTTTELSSYGPELSDAELDSLSGGCRRLPYVKPPSILVYNEESGTWERIYLNDYETFC